MCAESRSTVAESDVVLRTVGLRKTYESRGRLGGQRRRIIALDGVDLAVRGGMTLGLVGESGCGKSTFARCVVRLEEATSGEVWFDGQNIALLTSATLRTIRRRMQLVFQDPASAFHPGWPAWKIAGEPLRIAGTASRREQRERACELMEQVGLSRGATDRAPDELSGGQKQRLAIARALALEPQLLILDEAFSALDLSTQAQVANLLIDLQQSQSFACLFITHDLNLAARFCDEIAVMAAGRIVEHGASASLLQQGQHPRTRALLAAVPRMPAFSADEAR